ncbi:MAG: hypothetical protein MUF22_04290 [Chitinispirillaceae bacterium]|jgi:hypothetical protein|nr:hypothetical protein [Chitinispirillaceae bacterium]
MHHRLIFHIDLDAFFASIEQRDHPSCRSRHSKRKPLPCPANVAKVIYKGAVELLAGIEEPCFRLIGVGITNLDRDGQTNLFAEENLALEKAETAADSVAERFGRLIISKGREITTSQKKKAK